RGDDRMTDKRHASLPWVRRATGGGAILHDGDLTYAIALPKEWAKVHSPADWHCRIHRAFAKVLANQQIAAEVAGGAWHASTPFDCFAFPQPGDVVSGNKKIIGGAQRLRAGSLLQHGSLQGPAAALSPVPLGPELANALGWETVENEWTQEEWNRIRDLAVYKYGLDSW